MKCILFKFRSNILENNDDIIDMKIAKKKVKKDLK